MNYKTNDSQYGWTVVEIHRDEAGIYLIEDGSGNRYHVPCIIWDSLKNVTERAQEYRKSRNYFRESRDEEKKNASELHIKLSKDHARVVYDLQMEIAYYQTELTEQEGSIRNLKAYLTFVVVALLSSLFYIFI